MQGSGDVAGSHARSPATGFEFERPLTSALRGHGGAVVLAGGSAPERTAYLRRLVAAAELSGAQIGIGSCTNAVVAPPLSAFVDVLSSLARRIEPSELRGDLHLRADVLAEAVPALRARLAAVAVPPRLAPKEERYRLFNAILAFILARAERAPVVVAITDLHLADEPTIALLRHICRFILDKPVLVVVTTKDVMPNVPGDVITIAEGPEPVPDGPPEHLSADALTYASVASVFEATFDADVVAAVAEVDAIDELIAAGVIRPAPDDRFTFAEGQRSLFEATLEPARREEVHTRVASRLRAHAAATPIARLEIAWHLTSGVAARRAEAIDHAIAAAEGATAAGQHQLAVSALRVALAAVGDDDERRSRIEGRLGIALAWTLQPEEAAKVMLSAAAAIERSDGPDEALSYLAPAASLLTAATGHETAVPLATEGLRLAGSTRDWRWLTMLHLDSVRQVEDEDHPGIEVQHEHIEALRQLAMVSTDPNDKDHVSVLKLLHENAIFLPYESRDQLTLDLAIQFEETRNDDALSNAYFGLWSRVLHLKGDFEEIVRGVEPALESYERRGQYLAESITYIYLARAKLALGELDAAREAMSRATNLAAQLPVNATSIFTSNALNVLAYEDEFRMYTDEGWTWLLGLFGIDVDTPQPAEIVLSTIKGTSLWINGAPFLAAMGRIFARLGHPESAEGFVEAILPALDQGYGWTNNYVRMVCDAAEALWFANKATHIAIIEDALRQKIVGPDFRYPFHDGRLSLARICALTKRYDEAQMWFNASRSALAEQGSEPMLAICDFDEAWMHLRRGDRATAQPLLDEARDRFVRLQMTGWVKRVDGFA